MALVCCSGPCDFASVCVGNAWSSTKHFYTENTSNQQANRIQGTDALMLVLLAVEVVVLVSQRLHRLQSHSMPHLSESSK